MSDEMNDELLQVVRDWVFHSDMEHELERRADRAVTRVEFAVHARALAEAKAGRLICELEMRKLANAGDADEA